MILMNFYTVKNLIISFILFISSILIYTNTRSLIPFYTIVFLVASKDKKIEDGFKSYFLGIIFSLLYVFANYFTGKIPTRILDGNSLGLINPNLTSFFITEAILIYFYVRYEKITILDLYILAFISLLVVKVTGCRTGFILILGLLILIFFVKSSSCFQRLILKYIFIVCIFILLFCYIGLFFVHSIGLFSKIDEILSGRFRWGQIYFILYGINLFGSNTSNIADFGYGNLNLDTGFFYCLIQFGIFYFLFFIGLYYKSLIENKKNRNYKNLILILMIFTGLVSESLWIPITNNIFILICEPVLFSTKKRKHLKFLSTIF